MPIGLGLLRRAEPFRALAAGWLAWVFPSPFHLPAPLRSIPVTGLPRYYGRSDCVHRSLGRLSCGDRSQRYPMNPSSRPCSNHPTLSRDRGFDALGALRGSRLRAGFAILLQAPHKIRPNRVQVHCFASSGPRVRSGLLPTPPVGDAVTLCFSSVSHLRRVTTFTFCVHGFRSHNRPLLRS